MGLLELNGLSRIWFYYITQSKFYLTMVFIFQKYYKTNRTFFIGNEELLCFYILFVRKNFSQDSFLFSVRSSFYSKSALTLAYLQLNNVFY